MSQFDLFGAKQARDEALEQVARNAGDFNSKGIVSISRIPSGSLVIGEDIRVRLANDGLIPHHHNAWGSLIKYAISCRILTPTGEYRHMRTGRSHARKSPVYRVR